MSNNTLVGYHSNCNDGLGALSIVEQLKKPNSSLFTTLGLDYSSSKEASIVSIAKRNMIYDEIIFVDYCPSEKTINELKALRDTGLTFKLTILDHHIHRVGEIEYAKALFNKNDDTVIFDNNRSGTGLTWDYLHPDKERPLIVDLIEDRDLWNFKYGKLSRAAHIEIRQGGKDFIMDCIENKTTDFSSGIKLVDFEDKIISSIIRRNKIIQIDGHDVVIINCPSELASQACSNVFEETVYNTAISYAINGSEVHVSCRSTMFTKLTARTIAMKYDGGGHEHAAGCKISLEQLSELLNH